MNEDMSELINKINSMVNQNSNNDDNSNNKSASGNSSISPETISKMVEMLKSKSNDNTEKSNTSNSSNKSNSNIDVDTILKFKTIFEKLNSKDDPRSNLLLALKPYLKESRKQKVEQYIQFFNVSKILDEFGPIAGGDVHK